MSIARSTRERIRTAFIGAVFIGPWLAAGISALSRLLEARWLFWAGMIFLLPGIFVIVWMSYAVAIGTIWLIVETGKALNRFRVVLVDKLR